MSIGVPVTALGLACIIGGRKTNNDAAYISGWIISSIGEPIMIASIPLTIVGQVKQRNAYETYNEECAGKKLSLNLKAYPNGVGLAFNF